MFQDIFLNLKNSQIAIVLTPASISKYDITKNILDATALSSQKKI
jgi:hypothetical protein